MNKNKTSETWAFMLRARFVMALVAMLCCATGARAQETLTVNDGSTTDEYVPVYGYYVDTQGTT